MTRKDSWGQSGTEADKRRQRGIKLDKSAQRRCDQARTSSSASLSKKKCHAQRCQDAEGRAEGLLRQMWRERPVRGQRTPYRTWLNVPMAQRSDDSMTQGKGEPAACVTVVFARRTALASSLTSRRGGGWRRSYPAYPAACTDLHGDLLRRTHGLAPHAVRLHVNAPSLQLGSNPLPWLVILRVPRQLEHPPPAPRPREFSPPLP